MFSIGQTIGLCLLAFSFGGLVGYRIWWAYKSPLRTKSKPKVNGVGDLGDCKDANPLYKHFDIEYMPLSGRYYPRHRGQFLFYWSAGYWTLYEDRNGVKYGTTEEEARRIYDQYLEQSGVTAKIIKPCIK